MNGPENHHRLLLFIRSGRTSLLLLAVALLAVMNAGALHAQAKKGATITPVLPRSQLQRAQPFGGEFAFAGPVALGKPVKVVAELTCHRRQEDTVLFRLIRAEVYDMPFTPDTIRWAGPIDSGSTKRLEFTFTPKLVGLHRIALANLTKTGWNEIGALTIAINEDGQVVCAAASDQCRQAPVTPHPLRSERPIVMSFPKNELISVLRQDRHFTAKFQIDPATKLKDSTRIEFALECFVPLYQEVQFIVEHSTNIAVSKLPESWGNWAGPAPGYRLFNGRFAFVALKPGITYLNFKIVGQHPFAKKGDRITTEYPMYFVIGETGELLFAGTFDPFGRFKEKSDPMLGTLTSLLDVTEREYRTRAVLSQPDYQGQSIERRDSLNALKAAGDTTKK